LARIRWNSSRVRISGSRLGVAGPGSPSSPGRAATPKHPRTLPLARIPNLSRPGSRQDRLASGGRCGERPDSPSPCLCASPPTGTDRGTRHTTGRFRHRSAFVKSRPIAPPDEHSLGDPHGRRPVTSGRPLTGRLPSRTGSHWVFGARWTKRQEPVRVRIPADTHPCASSRSVRTGD
jgi:hypothetical protein